MGQTSIIRLDQHDLHLVSFESNTLLRARKSIFAVDKAMRENYAIMKANLIPHLSPVIVVNNDEQGGEYTLIYKGKRETWQPISPVFEMAKAISHVPLGIYVIIAPYLKQPESVEWIRPLEEFGQVLHRALKSLDAAALPKDAKDACTQILEGGLRFISKSVKKGHFSIQSFMRFSGRVSDAIKTNMQCAAEAQAVGVEALLKRWKKEMGDEQWKKLYTVVLAIWTTSERNQNSVIVRKLMDQQYVDSHLITISTAETPADPVGVALDNLARIVQDNIAADMIFPNDPLLSDSLKGAEDLLSNAIEDIIYCPHMSK